MFNEIQKAELAKPLYTSNVKSRKQGGAQVSYIEGWHAIAEANRIFGFDAWSRQTLELKCVSEQPREIGEKKAPGFGVTYIARVRIAVGDIIRDGSGSGHGIDRDLGQAHESALKEAETDAMKRALMTFGNPFGLALYDKERANVADEPDESVTAYVANITAKINGWTGSAQELGDWWNSDSEKQMRRHLNLDSSDVDALKKLVIAKRSTLTTPLQMAG